MLAVHILALILALVCFLMATFGTPRLAWGWLGAAVLTADALLARVPG